MFEPTADDISAVIIAADIKEVQNEVENLINETDFPIRLNAFDLFCQKTGHKIGTRDNASLFALIKICGKDVASNIYNCTTFNVHPAWLHTGPDDLDALIESDPVGYATYCLGMITAQFYQSKRNQNPRLYPGSDRLWAMARANALLSQQGVGQITELNVELARMVSFMPNATNHFFNALRKYGNTPDKLALLHCTGSLIERIHAAVNTTLNNIGTANRWIQRTSAIDRMFATPEDAARGPSHIRKQRVSEKKIKEAALMNELEKLFADSGLDKSLQATNLPGSTAWRDRMAKQRSAREMQEADLAMEIAALAEITNLALPSDIGESEDETSVEVHFLPIEEPTRSAGDDTSLIQKSQGQTAEQVMALMPYIPPIDTTPIKEAVMGQMKNRPQLFKEISGQESQRKIEQEKSGLRGVAYLRWLKEQKGQGK